MIKVMLVEDDPMVMEITQKYIESVNGFGVVAKAANGNDALALLKKNPVDLMTVDVYMPQMNGLELLHAVRKNNLPVDAIFVTASNDTEMIDAALKLGVVDYLIKPFNYERLKNALESYAKRRELLQKGGSTTQSELDSLLSLNSMKDTQSLQKGLHSKTLEYIRQYIANTEKQVISADEIAKELGISKVTVRRYMEYLVSINEVFLQIEYGAVGRPTYTYRKSKAEKQ